MMYSSERVLHVDHSGVYSTTPPSPTVPLFTFSPFARTRSSTVLSLPSSVLSLNHPKWSAMRCLTCQVSTHNAQREQDVVRTGFCTPDIAQ